MGNEKFNLKVAYEKLKEKYDLPEFEKLAEDFDIEKNIDKESNFILREIRRSITEKISGYLQLFEILINPSAPPMFIFSILRNISAEDKIIIKEVYKTLSKIQIEAMKLDVIYGEDNEETFIEETFGIWQKLKPTVYKLIEKFETNFEEDDASKKRSYFA
jgi:hypothetical protein